MIITMDPVREKIIAAIKEVFDPEIPVNIYDLGLIYEVSIHKGGLVKIQMTLTSPACPVAETLPMEVQEKVIAVEGVTDVDLRVVFQPSWTKDRMSEEARFALDMF
jgi:FeS assembly SUF system protein